MTYCVGITVDRGLVMASDSRTNAGADQISTFSKMSTFCGDGERFFALLTAGNLATTQAVVTQIQRDIDKDARVSLLKVPHLSEAAEYVGRISRTQQEKHAKPGDDSFKVNASFILGGQIAGRPPGLFLIYPEGNYIRACEHTPFLQIGELKYGKPILDRLINPEMALEDAARCVLVSMDSTMRSNATVGPPIEVLLYSADSMTAGRHLVLREDDDYLRELRLAWQDSLRRAFNGLPKLPGSPARVRLVDG
jgi:putative proteasome-type protease